MRVRQTNKQKTFITTYIEFLGACITSKKTVYIEFALLVSSPLLTSCFATIGSSACQRNLLFPDMYSSSSTLPHKLP